MEFAEEVLERYNYDDSLRLSRKDFMDWVNSPDKDQNASTLLQEFESRFARLSRLDRTVLETSTVLFFVTSFDSRVQESVIFFWKPTEASRLTGRPSKSMQQD